MKGQTHDRLFGGVKISQRLEMKGSAIHNHVSSVKMKCSKTNNFLNFSVHDLNEVHKKQKMCYDLTFCIVFFRTF